MKELNNNQNVSRMSYKLVSSCDALQAFTNVFLKLDILGFFIHFYKPLHICQVNHLLRSNGLFHYWLY